MKNIKNSALLFTVLFAFTNNSGIAQVKNSKTETVKIYGNCGMCETNIEKAGNVKKVARVDWNMNTQMATIIYDTTKTNQDEILKRIALAGYDSDKFLAPDDVYSNLHGCCQYERVAKISPKTEEATLKIDSTQLLANTMPIETQEVNELKLVYDNYFALKDALVNSDRKLASTIAKDLLSNIHAVNMSKLSTEAHSVWMEVMKDLIFDTEHIEKTKDLDSQRDHFMRLSKNMYSLMKVSKCEEPVFYQFCPMANDGKGANWLSKENTIKNPYYGAQMLGCGKTAETIK